MASFGSSEYFVIAFMGSGQTTHFDDISYSGFANIDPDHSSVKMKDEPLVFVENMSFRIGKEVHPIQIHQAQVNLQIQLMGQIP